MQSLLYGRDADRAGKVRDAGIDRDHQIEGRNHFGRIREIGKLVPDVQKLAVSAQDFGVLSAEIFLQTDKCRIQL